MLCECWMSWWKQKSIQMKKWKEKEEEKKPAHTSDRYIVLTIKIYHLISNKCQKMCDPETYTKRTPTFPTPDSQSIFHISFAPFLFPFTMPFMPFMPFICRITFFWFNNSAIVLRFTCSNWIRFDTFRLRLKNDNLIKGLFSFNVTRIMYIRMDIRILLVYISVQRTLNVLCIEKKKKKKKNEIDKLSRAQNSM